jgi:hypothetical protein
MYSADSEIYSSAQVASLAGKMLWLSSKKLIERAPRSWDMIPIATEIFEEMNLERELVDAFERIVHEDCPNPRRMNCPPDRGPSRVGLAS